MNRFNLPYNLIMEEGVFECVDEVMADCVPGIQKKKVVIVTESMLLEIFSHCLAEIQRDFKESEIYLVEQGSFDTAVTLAKYICMNEITVVIGFGGGKVLDIAKYAAFISKTMYLCLPTTLSNDSLASPVAVLGTQGDNRQTFGCKIPSGIIVDLDVIMTTPEIQLKSGIGDTISKYTALYDWKLDAKHHGKNVNDFAYMISDVALTSLCYHEEKSLKSKSFLKVLTQALVMGGLAMEISGSSRPSSGSEHLFCHSLEENYKEVHIMHGMAVAMGTIPAAVFQKRKHTEKLIHLMKTHEMDINPKSYDITKEIFIGAWQKAKETRRERYTILNETDLSKERLGMIYDKMVEGNYSQLLDYDCE